ncbi:MAG: aldehyde dehydrogenase family protein [Reichenbachiella sp.]
MSDAIQELFEIQKARSFELRTEPLKYRKARLKKLRKWILNNKPRIREALFKDFKKPETEVDISEIYPVASELNKALRNLSEWSRPKKVSSGLTFFGTMAAVVNEPKGTTLIIAPWNFPFQLLFVPLVSSLAAGNTAILKPSENTPATSKLAKEMIAELFDPSEVSVVQGSVNETTELLKLSFDHIFFTGSTAVGKIIMEAAAKNLTTVTLELGGKSPTIIDETANIKDAAKKIAWGKFFNNGQTCIAPDYLLIHESKYSKFIEELSKAINSTFDSDNLGIKDSKDYAIIVNERHASRLINLLDEAKQNGAQVIHGGENNKEERFIEPTVITSVDESCKISKEEIFGPIFPIYTYTNLDLEIQKINNGPKPLALYLFSNKKSVQQKVLKQTSSGSMAINDVVIQFSHPNMSFGGVNHSGMGKSHGYPGFLAFSNEKSVLKQRTGLTTAMLFYPPYNVFKKRIVDFVIKWF